MTVYQLTVNLDGVAVGLQRSLQRAMDLVSFGLHAAQVAQPPLQDTDPAVGTAETVPGIHRDLALPGVLFQMIPASEVALTFDTARQLFHRWVLACGFRDATEALAPLLEEARTVGVVASAGRTITAAVWKDQVLGGRQKFDRMTLKDKIHLLVQVCGSGIVPSLMPQVETIVVARNCLVHRRGVVGERDINHKTPEGDSLKVEWLAPQFVVTSPDGGERVITELPFVVKGGGTIVLRQMASSRTFRRGETVDLTASEFNNVCWTLLMFAKQLVANLRDLLVAKGLLTVDGTDNTPDAQAENGNPA